MPSTAPYIFAFTDDIALQPSCPNTIHNRLAFLFLQGPKYGLFLIEEQTEIQRLNDTPHVTIRISPLIHFHTLDNTNVLKSEYAAK